MEKIFKEIDKYWSWQKNNEIYLKGKKVEYGSEEYWSIIETKRFKYLYYLPKILKYLQENSGKKLLEVGCGMGLDLSYFVQNGFDVTGIDIAQEHLKLAQSFFSYKNLNASFHHMNAEEIQFPDEHFDSIYSFGVLHHTQTPQNGINEIYRLLKKNGKCAVMLYHKYSLNNFVHTLLRIPFDNPKEMKMGGNDANFVYRYSKKEIRVLFEKFSHVKIHIEYIFGAGWEPIYSLTPKLVYTILSKLIGWHLVVLAEK